MLTQQQIDDIAFYCYTRNVEYYDVQLELVDHIADIIEHLQKTNAALSFSEALELAGKQFSDEEFKIIVKGRKKFLQKKVSRLIEKELVSFFTIPKIILTLTLFFTAYFFPLWLHVNKALAISALIIVAIPVFFYVLMKYYKLHGFKKEINNSFQLLSNKIRSKYEIVGLVLGYSINISVNFLKEIFNTHFTSDFNSQLLLLSLAIFVILYLAIYEVRYKFITKMKQDYPQAFAL